MSTFLAPCGYWPRFIFRAIKTEAKTPIGFPITNPAKIPQAIGELIASLIESLVITTPVFAKAKSGTIIKLLQG